MAFQWTQKVKLFDALRNIQVAFPDLASELKSEFDEDTELVYKADAGDAIDVQPEEMIIVGVISSLSVDSYNEVVLPEGGDFSTYSRNRVVLWGHNYYDFLPHGENAWIKPYPGRSPNEVRAATKYYDDNPRGLEVYNHRAKKRPLGYSIGFIPLKWVKRGDDDWVDEFVKWRDRYVKYANAMSDNGSVKAKDVEEPDLIYLKWKLLEYSDVVVPANPDSVQLYVEKGFIQPEEATEYIKQEPREPVQVRNTDIALAPVLDIKKDEALRKYVINIIKETEQDDISIPPEFDVAEPPEESPETPAKWWSDIVQHDITKIESPKLEIGIDALSSLKNYKASRFVAEVTGKLE